MTNREMERAFKTFLEELYSAKTINNNKLLNDLIEKYDAFDVKLCASYKEEQQTFSIDVREGVLKNHERVVLAMALNSVYTSKNLDHIRKIFNGQLSTKEFKRTLRDVENRKAIEAEVYVYRLLGLDLSDKEVKDFFTAFIISLYLITMAERGKLKERIMEGVYTPLINALCVDYIQQVNKHAEFEKLPCAFDIFVLENIYSASNFSESDFELDDEKEFLSGLAVALSDNFRLITNDSVIKRLRTELTKTKNKQPEVVKVVDTYSQEELKKVRAELKMLQDDYSTLYNTLDDITQRNFALEQENYKLNDLVSTFKETATDDEYLEHEIEALEVVEEIDLSKYKIVLIAHDALDRKFKYDVYDYIKQPSRLNRLLSCDVVGIVIQCCKHKQTIAVVDFCKKMNIHYCYIDDRNQDMIDDTLKHYIKYKM